MPEYGPTAATPSVWSCIGAGLRGRCPRCGQGRLFAGFLEVADGCNVCGLRMTEHDAGDGPAVFATFLLGFVVVGCAGAVEYLFGPPLWVHVALWLPLTVLGTAAVLRPLKGVTVALQYRHRSVTLPTRPGGA